MVPASDGWEEVEGLGKVQRGGDTLMWFHNPSLNPFFLFILLDFSKIQTPQLDFRPQPSRGEAVHFCCLTYPVCGGLLL